MVAPAVPEERRQSAVPNEKPWGATTRIECTGRVPICVSEIVTVMGADGGDQGVKISNSRGCTTANPSVRPSFVCFSTPSVIESEKGDNAAAMDPGIVTAALTVYSSPASTDVDRDTVVLPDDGPR